MDYKKKYEQALINARQEYNTTENVERKQWLKELFPELRESEDGENKRISKEITQFLKQNNGWNREWIDWLEKQKTMDKEIIFRPLVGTDIRIAVKQALEKIEIGKEVVLAFNGAYIPVNGKTVGEICNEYDAWLEKQSEQKPITIDIDKMCDSFAHTNIKGYGIPSMYEVDAYRKGINDALNLSLGIENQGEQKPAWSEEDGNMYEVKKKKPEGALKELLDNIDTLEYEKTRREMKEYVPNEDFEAFAKAYMEENDANIVSFYDRYAGLVDGVRWQKSKPLEECAR